VQGINKKKTKGKARGARGGNIRIDGNFGSGSADDKRQQSKEARILGYQFGGGKVVVEVKKKRGKRLDIKQKWERWETCPALLNSFCLL